MSDFADVEEFGRLHAACGGIKPAATPEPSGGYLLTLTCACGATLDRRVTVEDAKKPLPLPRRSVAPAPPAQRPAPSRPAPAPSSELQEALRAALAADAGTDAPPAPATPPAPPSGDLERVMREALASSEAAPVPPRAPASPAAPERTSPGKLNLDSTIRTALSQQSALTAAAAARPAPPRTRLAWLIVLALVVCGASAALYFGLRGETATPAVGEAPPPAPTLDERQRAALDEILASLRQLQSASSPGTSLSVYSSRVIFAKSDVARFMASTAPGPVRARVREVLDIHLLAAAAWRARSLDQRETWEAVGQDPAIDLCPSVKRVVDFSVQPSDAERARARGVAVASSIPLLWECAAQKLAALDQTPGR